MLQIHANVCTGGDRHEGCPQLSIVDPNLNIRTVKEHVQSARMVEMQVANDNLFDVFKLITRSLDGGLQFMLRLILYTCEDVRDCRTPYLRIVFSAASLPKNESLMWMVDQNAVHGQLATLVNESLILCALQTGVASTNDESLVTLEPSNLKEMELSPLWADIGNEARNGAPIELALDSGHFCCAEGWNDGLWVCLQVQHSDKSLRMRGNQERR